MYKKAGRQARLPPFAPCTLKDKQYHLVDLVSLPTHHSPSTMSNKRQAEAGAAEGEDFRKKKLWVSSSCNKALHARPPCL